VGLGVREGAGVGVPRRGERDIGAVLSVARGEGTRSDGYGREVAREVERDTVSAGCSSVGAEAVQGGRGASSP